MEVILTQSVPKLGDRGSIVYVADGYGRNYLLPKGLAIPATKGARKQAEAMQRAEERREQQRVDAAMTERDKLHGKAVTVRARATSEGKLYGSVSAKDICEALRETHGISEDPERARIDEPIRTTGSHTVRFAIYKDVDAEVTVTVKAVEGGPEDAVEEPTAEDVQRAPKPKPIITDSAQS